MDEKRSWSGNRDAGGGINAGFGIAAFAECAGGGRRLAACDVSGGRVGAAGRGDRGAVRGMVR